eukprot:648088-Prymnesium_polylepis.1
MLGAPHRGDAFRWVMTMPVPGGVVLSVENVRELCASTAATPDTTLQPFCAPSRPFATANS